MRTMLLAFALLLCVGWTAYAEDKAKPSEPLTPEEKFSKALVDNLKDGMVGSWRLGVEEWHHSLDQRGQDARF